MSLYGFSIWLIKTVIYYTCAHASCNYIFFYQNMLFENIFFFESQIDNIYHF